MNWSSTAQYSEIFVGFILIARLSWLNLHRVYRYFCIFLLAELSGTVIWIIQAAVQNTPLQFDYRIAWLLGRLVAWPFTLLTVYALLGTVLLNLQGILQLSRKVLNWSFVVALAIGLLTAIPEYHAASALYPLNSRLAHFTEAALVLDRAVTSVALIALLCILAFLLWFPVEMSRNICVFFVGFVVYFALNGCLLLVSSYWSPQLRHWTNIAQSLLSTAVFACWCIFISRAGEKIPKKLSLAWPRPQQELLIGQLEAMNASLLRVVRR